MSDKNKEREERKQHRKPPIPYSRKEPTKKQRLKKEMKQKDRQRSSHRGWDDYD